jgi:DNA-binding transcriptional regulator PaaX
MPVIKDNITGRILSLLAIGGVLALAIVAPNLVGAFGRSAYKKYKFDGKKYRKSINYLKQKRFVEVTKDGKIDYLKLTKSGKAHAFQYYVDSLFIKEPERWDGLWRIVISDIPNIRKFTRDTFRKKIQSLGFYQLQKSVVVYPYDCQKEVEFLIEIYNIKPYVCFIVAKSIDRQEEILKYFKLGGY